MAQTAFSKTKTMYRLLQIAICLFVGVIFILISVLVAMWKTTNLPETSSPMISSEEPNMISEVIWNNIQEISENVYFQFRSRLKKSDSQSELYECWLYSTENTIECNTESYQRPNPLLENCGTYLRDYLSQRISNGDEAEYNEFPWMAILINYVGAIICGGSLISDRFVLTAAHCVNNQYVVTVRLGEYNTDTDIDCDNYGHCAGPIQEIKVEKIFRHALYSPSLRKNDIALVKLAEPAYINGDSNVRTICLPFEGTSLHEVPETAEMVLSGWGHTENNTTSSILRKAQVFLRPVEDCNLELRRIATLDDRDMCGGGVHCAGDSGSPLQYLTRIGTRPIMVQHGLVTFGGTVCGKGLPDTYLKVSYYMDWISEHMK